jgi:serine/threonine protein kinase
MVCHFPNVYLPTGSLTRVDIIHGDVKPQNVLVFKDSVGKTTVRVTDFGYSTLASGEEGRVFVPKSRPWNAPEHHYGELTTAEAKKMDVYSFGMLCLWCLSKSARFPEKCLDYTFDASIGSRTSLEQIKDANKVEHIANQHIASIPDLNTEDRVRLEEVFRLTVPLNPNERTTNVGKLVSLLSQER